MEPRKVALGIVGIFDVLGSDHRLWNLWRIAFQNIGYELIVVRRLYHPFSRHAIRELTAQAIRVGTETEAGLIFGYSMGGIAAIRAAASLPNVSGVITYATPWRLGRFVDLPPTTQAPLVSVHGEKDPFFTPHLAQCPFETARQITVPYGHLAGYPSEKGPNTIVRQAFATLLSHRNT